jgi:beta-barrel assembly-enhancing protease
VFTRKSWQSGLLWGVVLVVMSGCAGSPDPSPGAAARVDPAEVAKEREVGEAAFAKLAGQYGIVQDAEATEYLNKYLQSLALFVERQELSYYAAILDTEQVNAYALPGGYIFVTVGTLRRIESPGELAGILAHELGHIEHKHILDNVSIEVEYSPVETLARLLAGGRQIVNTAMAQINDAIEERLFLEGYNVEDEYEADAYAVRYLETLGISAGPYEQFLTRLSSDSSDDMENLGATHPPLDERLRRIDELQSTDNALRVLDATEEFIQFRDQIRSMPVQTADARNT